MNSLKKLTFSMLLSTSFATQLLAATCSDSYCSNPNVPLFSQVDPKLAKYISSQIGYTIWDKGWCGGVSSAMITRGAILSSEIPEEMFRNYGHGDNYQTKELYYFQDRLNPNKYAQIYDVMNKVGTNIHDGGTYNHSVDNYFYRLLRNLTSHSGRSDVNGIRYQIRNSAALYFLAIAAYKNGDRQWGHAVVIRGYDQDKLIINDPWGKIYNVSVDGSRLYSTEGGSVQSIQKSNMEAHIEMAFGYALKKNVNGQLITNNLSGENKQATLGQVNAPALSGNKYYLKGWACGFASDAPALVHIYADSTYLGSYPADKTSGLDISRNCGANSNTSAHTFQIPVELNALAHRGKKLIVYARSPNGNTTNLLMDSGTYKIPDPRQVIGNIDGISAFNGTNYVHGWTCALGHSQSITAQLFATKSTEAKMVGVASAAANLVSGAGVSKACGTNATKYSFRIPISDANLAKFRNQKIYVKGISPFKFPNNKLSNSGKLIIQDKRIIKGHIDGIAGKATLNGWVCAYSSTKSIDVHLYAGGAAGAIPAKNIAKGQIVVASKANLDSGDAVAKACGTNGKKYAFKIPLSNESKLKFAGKTLYVHGLSPFKLENSLIGQSGKFKMPDGDTRVIKGNIDGLSNDKKSVWGWACAYSSTQPVDVHMYVVSAKGVRNMVGATKANLASEAGVSNACGTKGKTYRFNIPISDAVRAKYANEAIYIYGISPFKLANNALGKSGTFIVSK